MPYALIGWGGTSLGKRPATRFAWVDDKHIQTWNGKRWVNSTLTPETTTVYKTWKRWPTEAAIQRAKHALPVMEKEVLP